MESLPLVTSSRIHSRNPFPNPRERTCQRSLTIWLSYVNSSTPIRKPSQLFSHLVRCNKQQTSSSTHPSISSGREDQNSSVPRFISRASRCFDFSRRLVSVFIPSYLVCLTLVGDAHGYQDLPLSYACEDVSHYYASVDHMRGESLCKELNSIISNHRSFSYKQVWEALKILDAVDVDNPEASSNVVEIYSLKAVSKLLAGKPGGWNREHLWPRSYGLTDGPSLTDLHNIRPADVNVNSSRGNKYYGECLADSAQCLKPANDEAAPDTETDKSRWAPPLQVRGDIARALMYMAVCYGFNQSDGSPNLHLSDSPSKENKEMGLLSTLLKWNELDPPSEAEKLRNNRVCQLYQHNRNPFVDHPEYANMIWKPDIPGSRTMYTPTKAWINEFHCNDEGRDQNEFLEVVVGPGKTYSSLSLMDTRVFNIKDGGSGFLVYTAFTPLQNGPGDGIALVSDEEDGHVHVIQFLFYDGVVQAINGPAMRTESVDIGIQETERSSESDSLGLTGARVTQFRWTKFINEASPSKSNSGQILLE